MFPENQLKTESLYENGKNLEIFLPFFPDFDPDFLKNLLKLSKELLLSFVSHLVSVVVLGVSTSSTVILGGAEFRSFIELFNDFVSFSSGATRNYM